MAALTWRVGTVLRLGTSTGDHRPLRGGEHTATVDREDVNEFHVTCCCGHEWTVPKHALASDFEAER